MKIADFGLATTISPKVKKTLRCGSPGYIAPEVLNNLGYGTKADIFSAGVILCVMLTGVSPFHGKNCREVLLKNKEGNISVYSGYWDDVSEEAKSLVLKMVAKDPETRCTAHEALQDPWFSLESTNLTSLSNAQDNMKRYQNSYRFHVGKIKPEEFIQSTTPLFSSSDNTTSPLLISDNIKERQKEKKPEVTVRNKMSKVKKHKDQLESSGDFDEGEIDENPSRTVEKVKSRIHPFVPNGIIERSLPKTPGFAPESSITYLKGIAPAYPNIENIKGEKALSSKTDKLNSSKITNPTSIPSHKNPENCKEDVNKASMTSTIASKRHRDSPKLGPKQLCIAKNSTCKQS